MELKRSTTGDVIEVTPTTGKTINVPLDRFVYEIQEVTAALTVKNGSTLVAAGTPPFLVISGTDATPENIASLMETITKRAASGGSGGDGVTIEEVEAKINEMVPQILTAGRYIKNSVDADPATVLQLYASDTAQIGLRPQSGGNGNALIFSGSDMILQGVTTGSKLHVLSGGKTITMYDGNIVLPNDCELLGTRPGNNGTVNLIKCSSYDLVDIGTRTLPLNTNTPVDVKPTNQEADEDGSQAHNIAYESDIYTQAGRSYSYLINPLPTTATINLATRFRFRVQKQNPGFSIIVALWDPSSDEETVYYNDGSGLTAVNVTSAGSVVYTTDSNAAAAYDIVITASDVTFNVHIGLSENITTGAAFVAEHSTVNITLTE